MADKPAPLIRAIETIMDLSSFAYWFACTEDPAWHLHARVLAAGRLLRERLADPTRHLSVAYGLPGGGVGPSGHCFANAAEAARVFGGETVNCFVASAGIISDMTIAQVCGHCIWRSPAGELHEVTDIPLRRGSYYILNPWPESELPPELTYILSPAKRDLDRWRKLSHRDRDTWLRTYCILLEPEHARIASVA